MSKILVKTHHRILWSWIKTLWYYIRLLCVCWACIHTVIKKVCVPALFCVPFHLYACMYQWPVALFMWMFLDFSLNTSNKLCLYCYLVFWEISSRIYVVCACSESSNRGNKYFPEVLFTICTSYWQEYCLAIVNVISVFFKKWQ